MLPDSQRSPRRSSTPAWAFGLALLSLNLAGGCSTAMQISPAAEAAFADDRPIEGSSVAMTVGGIACPQ